MCFAVIFIMCMLNPSVMSDSLQLHRLCSQSGASIFPRQEHWNGLPFPSPGNLPDPGIEPTSPALAGGFFTTESPVKLISIKKNIQK